MTPNRFANHCGLRLPLFRAAHAERHQFLRSKPDSWWPSREAVIEWEATVAINVPLRLFINDALVSMTARIDNALELREVDVRVQGTV